MGASFRQQFFKVNFVLFSLIMVFTSSSSLQAETNPPPPIEGTIVFHNGDWTIESGDNVYCGNGTLVLSGNLSILSGGKLTMKNATLLMNSTFEGEFGIEIENNGNLTLIDSRVSAYNTTAIVTHSWGTTFGFAYRYNTSGSVWVVNSIISYVWGGGERTVGGIRVIDGKLAAINSSVLPRNSMGIYGENATILLRNTSVSDVIVTWGIISLNGTLNLTDGVISNITERAINSYNSTTIINGTYISGEVRLVESNLSVEHNVVEGIGFYSLFITDSHGKIAHNIFSDASVCVYMLDIQTGEVIAENNTITNCTQLGMRLNQASPTIKGNIIQNCQAGISFQGSSPTVENTTIKDSIIDVLMLNNAHPIFLNSTLNVSKVGYFDNLSLLDIRWYLHVSVRFADNQLVMGGTISVMNVTGDTIGSAMTDNTGWARWMIIPALRAQDLDGDMVAESIGETIFYTPHRVIASNGSLNSEISIWLNSSLSIEMVLGELYNITITKIPTRGQVLVDGLEYSAPTIFQWLVNSSHSVEVQAIESDNWGTRYVFLNWSNGGDLAHIFIVPSENTTLIANFQTQYLATIDLLGTDENHPAILTYFENGSSTRIRIWNNWQGWVDSESQVTLSVCTEGDVPRCTNDVHEWFVIEPLNATIHYEIPENWKFQIAILFGIIIALIGAWISMKHPRPYKKYSKVITWLGHIFPFVVIEIITGVTSHYTGILRIPPIVGLGTLVDVTLLIIGIAIPYAILSKFSNEISMSNSVSEESEKVN